MLARWLRDSAPQLDRGLAMARGWQWPLAAAALRVSQAALVDGPPVLEFKRGGASSHTQVRQADTTNATSATEECELC